MEKDRRLEGWRVGRLVGWRVRDRKQKTGDRRQETGNRRQKTGDRKQETEDRRRLEGWMCSEKSRSEGFEKRRIRGFKGSRVQEVCLVFFQDIKAKGLRIWKRKGSRIQGFEDSSGKPNKQEKQKNQRNKTNQRNKKNQFKWSVFCLNMCLEFCY